MGGAGVRLERLASLILARQDEILSERTSAARAAVITAIVDGVLLTDTSGRVTDANEAAARIFDLPRTALLSGLDEIAARLRTKAPEPEPSCLGRRALAGEVVGPVERIVVRPSGELREVRATASPLCDEEGRIEGALIVLGDVTHARGEEEQRQRLDEEREAVRVRDDVLAIVSHDLRNPLGTIAMSAAMLLESAADDGSGSTVTKRAEVIKRAAQRMSRLIDDLLDLAMIQEGRLSMHLGSEDPGAIATEIVESHGSVAAAKSIELGLHVDRGIGMALCDRDRVVQAIENLISNALRVVAPGGRIEIGVEARPGEIVLSVSDTGPGIPEDQLRRIFDRYWRGDGTGQHSTGLGLAITKGIVEAHGGRIWASSAVGEGSTFFFTLPDRSRG